VRGGTTWTGGHKENAPRCNSFEILKSTIDLLLSTCQCLVVHLVGYVAIVMPKMRSQFNERIRYLTSTLLSCVPARYASW